MFNSFQTTQRTVLLLLVSSSIVLATPATTTAAPAANPQQPVGGGTTQTPLPSTTPDNHDGTVIVLVFGVLIVLLLLLGAAAVVWRSCYQRKAPGDAYESGVSTFRMRPFVSSIVLEDMMKAASRATQEHAVSVPNDSHATTVVLPCTPTRSIEISRPHLQGSISAMPPPPLPIVFPAQHIRSSELAYTGLGSSISSFVDSSSNILGGGSMRTDATTSAADSNILSTFRSRVPTSVIDEDDRRGDDSSCGDDAAVMMEGDQRPSSAHFDSESGDELGSPSSTAYTFACTSPDTMDLEAARCPDTPRNEPGMNQMEYYQWARTLAAAMAGRA
ncbi:Aste57867_4160 [Aphanomyces stellatus]|uniref:Aste57867_4160 protein n=1 Tax=Aphanomyces stellatus TaxID=120398 RepID=A0A485KFH0_9STRA|nr:hypothetical protein As57867_004149 [Aphanomyces stellatus]VFT81287.1 Aste57867_4160 [Aphanomyces stellatus]